MIRFLNALALIAVIGSATWAYSVKYETILVAEKLKKREAELTRERDAVAILQAEWHLLNRPERMQSLARPEAGMQPTSARQIVRAADIPLAAPDGANPLDALLTGSIPTPDSARKTGAKSTGATPAPASRAAGQASKGVVPASTTGTARSSAKTAANQANSSKANQPLMLRSGGQARPVPPARIGAATAEAAPPPAASNPLTGFLKRLIQ